MTSKDYEEADVSFSYYQVQRKMLSRDRIALHLLRYGDVTFSQLPQWLQHALRNGDVVVPRRNPTAIEMQETEDDAFQHRKNTNTQTLDDYLDYFKGVRR